ncbi:hypothetical protein [Herbaspirillum sp. RV1423]|uniref:hypothetical protein n=1 Tax=Herbaspirillum sp. RV1423 TaxID=1443993 RepID=UPI000551FA84|nr:hypothetical protein [Herbaspirillum sp. RV1423]
MKPLRRLWLLTLTLNRFYVMALALALLLMASAGILAWSQALEQHGAALREGRFEFGLNTIRGNLESGLQVGLQLPEQKATQQLIEQVHAQERVILSVDIFDAQGHIVFTTDGGGVGANIPAAWRNNCLTSARTDWSTQDDEGRLLCGSVINGFGEVAGGVALRYRLANRAGTFGQFGAFWILALVWAAALTLIGGMFGWMLLRPLERRLQHQVAALAGEREARNDLLTGPLANALAQGRAIRQDLARTDRETDRIDNLEVR